MRRIVVFLALILLLISFISARLFPYTGDVITSQAIQNNSPENSIRAGSDMQNRILTPEQIRNIIAERNRLKFRYNQTEDCPKNCTCSGSVTRCQLENGREMIIMAGNSGNVILQIKGINASTNVTLYKSEGKVYGVRRNNETREIVILPDKVRERIYNNKLKWLENETIGLDENGTYRYQAHKRAKLLGFIPARVEVRGEINSETGEIIKIRNPWWAFLARDEEAQ